MGDTKDLSIGEVILLLRDDFPDVSVSKIRFLESQGLIDPDRTSSGYRQFDRDDLARIRFILQQQRDHFLPLKVIKSKLTLWERGEEPGMEPGDRAATLDDPGEPLDEGSLLKRSGLTKGQLGELIAMGLIKPVPGTTVFPPEAGIVASEAKGLMDSGLEPRHLRTIKLAVDREADLLLHLAAPLLKATNSEARARASELLQDGSNAVRAMHHAMISLELRQHLT